MGLKELLWWLFAGGNEAKDELRHAIERAHNLEMQVMLKLHLYPKRGGRERIGTAFDSEALWNAWFDSYGETLNYYAELAEDAGVEQLCVGVELIGTSHRADDWRKVVAVARGRFSGDVVYAANYAIEWNKQRLHDFNSLQHDSI